MGLFNHFPYTNFQNLNIDWLLSTTKQLEDRVNQLELLNEITDNDFVIHASLGSSTEQGGVATIDCTFDELAMAITKKKRPVIIADVGGSEYNNKPVYCYVNANLMSSQNKITLSWTDGPFDFQYASSNHSTCKLICRFLDIMKVNDETAVSFITMMPTIGG